MKQGDAVVQVVKSVFGELDGAYPETGRWNDAQKEQVYGTLFKMFRSGEIVHSKSPDDAELMKYIPGLVNNWVRKSDRLNGGVKYTPKNPGSRKGSGDPSIKAMKTLLSTIDDPTERANIEKAIKARQEELKPKPTVDVSVLPEELRHLVSN